LFRRCEINQLIRKIKINKHLHEPHVTYTCSSKIVRGKNSLAKNSS
jgi:hypothetical protein